MLAKAVASEVDAEVYNIKLTDIATSAYINTGSNNVQKLFAFIRQKAQNNKKIVVILDELDSLFGKRDEINGSREDTKIVNTFLTEMSGFDTMENVIFIGTTNLLANIDPAVIRSGRLTTKVKVDLPNTDGLKQIYQIHLLQNYLISLHKFHINPHFPIILQYFPKQVYEFPYVFLFPAK